MRARRAPFTDARDGRLKGQIRSAFWWSSGKPLTTTELMERCYFLLPSKIWAQLRNRPWERFAGLRKTITV
jgi:hypothetical protein